MKQISFSHLPLLYDRSCDRRLSVGREVNVCRNEQFSGHWAAKIETLCMILYMLIYNNIPWEFFFESLVTIDKELIICLGKLSHKMGQHQTFRQKCFWGWDFLWSVLILSAPKKPYPVVIEFYNQIPCILPLPCIHWHPLACGVHV